MPPAGLALPADDMLSAFREGISGGKRPDYVDPWGSDEAGWIFGSPLQSPKNQGAPYWQRCLHYGVPYTNPASGTVVPGEVTFDTFGHEIAMIGAKGTGKTHRAAQRAVSMVQRYPGSRGMIVANSYAQAFGSGGAKLVEVARRCGLRMTFSTSRTIDDLRFQYVYEFPDFDALICVLSFENIALIEGSEWDYAWFEEIQDCAESDVETAVSRLRRGKGDNSVVYCGMPDDASHWMYPFFEKNGIALYEPSMAENAWNNPAGYFERMKRQYAGKPEFDSYIMGARISLDASRCLSRMSYDVNVKGPVAARASGYDPYLPLYVSLDFNINPMCAVVRQPKAVEFELPGGERVVKTVVAQIGEYELFGASTEAMCRLIYDDYAGHVGGGIVLGDATGNKGDTRSPGVTDWTIVRSVLGSLPGMVIRPGVVMNRRDSSAKRGRGVPLVTYSNPPVRDRIRALDSVMIDGDGHERWTFLASSVYESGGSAASCMNAKWDGRSNVMDDNDKKTDRRLPRTHFFDSEGYLAFYLTEESKAMGSLDPAYAAPKRRRPAGAVRGRDVRDMALRAGGQGRAGGEGRARSDSEAARSERALASEHRTVVL